MNKWLPVIAFSVLLLFPVGVQKIYADVIYESATLGPTGEISGISIFTKQILGSRFSVSQTVEVTEIGGHIGGSVPGGIFGAIVQLSGPLPSGSPFDVGEVIAFTTFSPNRPSTDISAPLSVILPPGDYALVFGSGLFGATGSGSMPPNNPLTPEGTGSLFFWNDVFNWVDGGAFTDLRFTVNGITVGGVGIGGTILPIDTTALLLAGVQTNLAWMIPVALSAVGIGIVLVRKK